MDPPGSQPRTSHSGVNHVNYKKGRDNVPCPRRHWSSKHQSHQLSHSTTGPESMHDSFTIWSCENVQWWFPFCCIFCLWGGEVGGSTTYNNYKTRPSYYDKNGIATVIGGLYQVGSKSSCDWIYVRISLRISLNRYLGTCIKSQTFTFFLWSNFS